MSITPEQADAIKRRAIAGHYHGTMRDRIAEVERLVQAVRGEIRAEAQRHATKLSDLYGQTTALKATLATLLGEIKRADDSTVALPTIPPPEDETTRRMRRD